MKSSEIRQLLALDDRQQIDFNVTCEPIETLGKAICGMLNSSGGFIVCGVTDDHVVSGISLDEGQIAILEHQINEGLSPKTLVSFEAVQLQQEKLVIIEVPAGQDVPYAFQNVFYIRRGKQNQIADAETVRDMVIRRQITPERWERRLSVANPETDLDTEEVVQAVRDSTRVQRAWFRDEQNAEMVLEDLSAAKYGRLTNGGDVLFSLNSARRLPQTRLRAYCYSTDKAGDKFSDMKSFEGPAIKLIEQAYRFIVRNTSTPASFMHGDRRREDSTLYPEAAVMEALINAVAHRDYSKASGGIAIHVFPRRLEIWNSGPLPKEVSVESLGRGQLSVLRNPDIAHVLYLRGVMEKAGRGSVLIVKKCHECGLPEPNWQSDENLGVTLTFFAPGFIDEKSLASVQAAADLIQQTEAAAMIERWTRALKGEPLEGEPHRLDVFVEPRISIRLPQPQAGKGGTEEKWETLPAGVHALLDQHFIPSDRWLVITEDAGGGKTVLSWLLAAELSRRKERFWVVRYEGRFPEDLRKDLTTRLEGKLRSSGTEQTAAEVLNELLAQRRVVVIYDALDQDNSSTAVDRIHALRHSIPDDRLKTGLRLIVTSRPYAVNQNGEQLFHLAYWLHCRLELFDEGQQSDYRQQVARLPESRSPGSGAQVDAAYQQLLPDPEFVADLLAYPVVQTLIRSIIQAQSESGAKTGLRPFRNAGDLYWEVASRLLDRAFKSGRYVKTSEEKSGLFQLLACYGYLMMLGYRDYRVPETDITAMHKAVRERCGVSERDWERYENILRDTAVTEHLLFKENDQRELSFPSLKMAEFFAGLYLGSYCDERVLHELRPEIGRNEWNNVWRFVAELPETSAPDGHSVCHPESLRHSLQALFGVPDQGRVRPTESMFRAWQVLTRNNWLSEVREHVLGGWRQQFRRILIEGYEQGKPTARARTAAEVVFDGDLQRFIDSAVDPELTRLRLRLDELESIKRPDRRQKAELQTAEVQFAKLDELNIEQWCQQLRPSFETYALCSDAQKGDPEKLTFMMGASAADKDAIKERETPWQKVIVPAFYMATACVTRAQYALFDPQREREHRDLPQCVPEPDCPMIYINFHDGICFALWLGDGYSLPSEVQWEGAAWGGLDREQHLEYVIGVPPYTANFTSAEVNFDGNHPLQGPKSEYRERTVPVRFSEFQPNGFGLWQMIGNVWEYTCSEGCDSLHDAIGHEKGDLSSGSAEASRCVRGGSWNYVAGAARCSLRSWNNIRYLDTGIRLSRTK